MRHFHRSGVRSRGQRRNVTWGSASLHGQVAAANVAAQWALAPSNATPASMDLPPRSPTDATLIRTVNEVVAVVEDASTLFIPCFFGLIAWGGTDASLPPGQTPIPSDGGWDWIIRIPVLFTPGTGLDVQQYFSNQNLFSESRAMRKFGKDLGLLMVIDNSQSGVVLNWSWDVRYALKLAT